MSLLKRIIGGLLRLGFLYLLLPLLLIDLILIQSAVPRLVFQWQAFAIAAAIWLAAFAAVAYFRKTRTPLIWGGVSLAYATAFFASLMYAVIIAGTSFSGIPLLMAFAFLVGAVNFLYRNRYGEPLLALLPICAAAWTFIVLLYQPCLVAWALLVAGRQGIAETLLTIFGDSGANAVMLGIVVLPAAIMYFLGKHAYVGVYGWTVARLKSKTGKGEPA